MPKCRLSCLAVTAIVGLVWATPAALAHAQTTPTPVVPTATPTEVPHLGRQAFAEATITVRSFEGDGTARVPLAVRAGDVLVVDLIASFRPYLLLEDSAGNVLATDEGSGEGRNARISGFVAAADGTLVVVASHARNLHTNRHIRLAPNFTIRVENTTLSGTTPEPIVYPTTVATLPGVVDVTIARDMAADVVFTGQAGQRLVILVKGDGINSTVTLLDPAGREIGYDDDGVQTAGASLLGPVTLPQDGQYTARVRDASSRSSGSATVTLALPEAIVVDGEVLHSVDTHAQPILLFDIPARQDDARLHGVVLPTKPAEVLLREVQSGHTRNLRTGPYYDTEPMPINLLTDVPRTLIILRGLWGEGGVVEVGLSVAPPLNLSEGPHTLDITLGSMSRVLVIDENSSGVNSLDVVVTHDTPCGEDCHTVDTSDIRISVETVRDMSGSWGSRVSTANATGTDRLTVQLRGGRYMWLTVQSTTMTQVTVSFEAVFVPQALGSLRGPGLARVSHL